VFVIHEAHAAICQVAFSHGFSALGLHMRQYCSLAIAGLPYRGLHLIMLCTWFFYPHDLDQANGHLQY